MSNWFHVFLAEGWFESVRSSVHTPECRYLKRRGIGLSFRRLVVARLGRTFIGGEASDCDMKEKQANQCLDEFMSTLMDSIGFYRDELLVYERPLAEAKAVLFFPCRVDAAGNGLFNIRVGARFAELAVCGLCVGLISALYGHRSQPCLRSA